MQAFAFALGLRVTAAAPCPNGEPIVPTTKHALVDTLLECGADHAFTLPGLGITWMLDEFHARRDQLRVVLTRSEQIASVMAQVYGKLTGRPGVFMGQGPFASTTGAFGILEAHFAGSPMVVLTDTSCYDGFGLYGVYQTMTGDYGAADVRTVLGTMTKYCAYATEPHEAVYGLQLAFKHAQLPRMGPAALVLKTPIIRREMPEQTRVRLYPSEGYLAHTPARPDAGAVAQLAAMLAQAKQPVIVAGQGAQSPQARALLATLADAAGIGVVTSYNGKGVVDETAPYAGGMLGTWGSRSANRLLGRADLVLVLGASLGPDYLRFRDEGLIDPRRQRLAQVDVDARHAGWVYPVELAITGDVADVLQALQPLPLGQAQRAGRLAGIAANNAEHGFGVLPATVAAAGTLHYADLVRVLDRTLTAQDMLVLDAGNNRIWVTAQLRLRTPGQLVVPGGIGGMGWGLPAAAATRLVHRDRNVICLIGDGGAAMTLSTLATCVQEQLPITVIVANNQGLGMVRDNMKDRRIAVDFSPMDFATIARGMGCDGVRVDRADALGDAIAAAREAGRAGRTTVIDVAIDPAASHVPASDY
jgi:acetolactate synthase-1/2/3 large subunit